MSVRASTRRRLDDGWRGVKRRLGDGVIALDRGGWPHRLLIAALRRGLAARLDPSAAAGLEATLELTLRNPHGRPPARFCLSVADRRCTVTAGPAPDAGARAALGLDDLVRLACGQAVWPELMSNGRFELSGDPFLALRFAALLRLPVSPARA